MPPEVEREGLDAYERIGEETSEVLERRPPGPELVRAYGSAAGSSMLMGASARCLDYAERTIALSEQHRFGSLRDIGHVKLTHGTTTYAPLKNEKKIQQRGADPYAPREGDTAAVVEWRKRMGSESARAIYKQRSSSAEWVNAGCRNRGLYRLVVRGVEKVKCCALWQALAHNLMVMWRTATRQRQTPVDAADSGK